MSNCQLDLGLLVDTTKSIKYENVPTLKAALRHLVNQFEVATDITHVSLQTFSKESTLHNKFNDDLYHSNDAIDDLITNSFDELNQPTRLDIALKTARDVMFTEESGQRPGVRSAMVLYTDGRSHPDTEDFFLDVIALKVRQWLERYQTVMCFKQKSFSKQRHAKNKEQVDFFLNVSVSSLHHYQCISYVRERISKKNINLVWAEIYIPNTWG